MHLGNYVTGHLARQVQRLLFLEWDEAQTPGIDGSAYHVHEGKLTVPKLPGFGLALDEKTLDQSGTGRWLFGWSLKTNNDEIC